jgi:molecular chaperone GrpE
VSEAIDAAFAEVGDHPGRAEAAPAAPAGGDAAEAADDAAAAELAAVTVERDQYLDHLRRLQAEFENYRKRVQRDNQSLTLRAGEGVVESLLPVVDNMARAVEAASRHEADQLVEGVELVAGQLQSVLVSHGLQEVPAEPGVPFDPTVHEAVLTQAHDEYPEGTIAVVLERGYLLHGRLLRPTKVIVAQ